MPISWEPGESDSTFIVSGSLLVTTAAGEKVLRYPKPVSVSAASLRDAKTKVRMMLLSRDGLTDTNVRRDSLEVTLKSDDA